MSIRNFIEQWAKKAWEMEMFFVGTQTGGIDGIKNLIDCKAVDNNTVLIRYDLPETSGLSDIRYHNIDPKKIRTDTFVFHDDGTITMNGKLFPDAFEDDPLCSEEAAEFKAEYLAERNSRTSLAINQT